MRSIKLIGGLAATAALLALATTVASARPASHKAAGKAGSCRVSIEVPPVLTVGDPVTVFGALTCPNQANAAGKAITVYERAAGTHRYTVVGTASTAANGSYTLSPAALATNTTFYARSGGAQSVRRTTKVQPEITLTGPADGTQLYTRAGPFIGARRLGQRPNKVIFTGTVTPAQAGAIVVLQRENSTATEEWRRIGTGVVGAGGSYAIAHTFAEPGDASIRVVVRSLRHNAPAASTPLSYEISQAQNRQLTILSSADPISDGQSVTISGTLAGGSKQPITLFAHGRGGKFTRVTGAMTDGSGNYTFMQSPHTSTFYQVQAAGHKSATLFEGVKYALTANVPPTNALLASQSLTITGTVSPAHAGHVVYLERRNGTGVGYHVVDLGTVTAGGTYSIAHAFYGVGSGQLRIKVPGDPENQGVDGPLFDVNVSAAPGALITPPAADNTKLPSEGQL
jgi:hypothetical protein